LFFGLLERSSLGPPFGFSAILFYGLFVGAVLGLLGAMVGGLLSMVNFRSTTEILRPNQGMRNSLKNALIVSLLLALLAGLFGWNTSGPERIDGVATYFGLVWPISFLYFGGSAFLHHVTLRLLVSYYNILPLNLSLFCDEMTQRILLRRVGGGWVFIHRYLLEYFSSLQNESEPFMDSRETNILSKHAKIS
jgi:hypothetical protein